MVEDDVLLRQIKMVVDAILRALKGGPEAREQLDHAAIDTLGVDIATFRRLPVSAIPAVLPAGGPGGVDRWVLAARLVLADAQARGCVEHGLGKALAIVELAQESGASPELVNDALEEILAASAGR